VASREVAELVDAEIAPLSDQHHTKMVRNKYKEKFAKFLSLSFFSFATLR